MVLMNLSRRVSKVLIMLVHYLLEAHHFSIVFYETTIIDLKRAWLNIYDNAVIAVLDFPCDDSKVGVFSVNILLFIQPKMVRRKFTSNKNKIS